MKTENGIDVGVYVYDNLHKFNKEFLRDLSIKIDERLK